jgi:hypothetical protein
LGLEGAQWIQSSDEVATPGKKIEWDLAFSGKANLDVFEFEYLNTSPEISSLMFA